MAGVAVRSRGVTADRGAEVVAGQLPSSVENITALSVRQTVYVSTTGNDANDGRNWTLAKATIASAKTALGTSAGTICCGAGSFPVSGLALANDFQGIVGMGRGVTFLTLNSNATAVSLSANRNMLADLTIQLGASATTATGIDLHGAFTASLSRFEILGQSTGGVGSFTGQTGMTTNTNAGDSFISHFLIAGMGVGIQVGSQYNFFYQGLMTNNVVGIQNNAGTGGGGGSFKNITCNGTGTSFVDLSGTGGSYDLDIWCDGGATNGIIIGDAVTGNAPFRCRLYSPSLAAVTNGLVINGGQVEFDVSFQGSTTTPLTINASHAQYGVCTSHNLPSTFVFPPTWTVIQQNGYLQQGGNPPAFNVSSTGLAISNAGMAKLNVATVNFDPLAWWDATNHRWTPKVAGYYRFEAYWNAATGLTTGGFMDIGVFKNGATPYGYAATRFNAASTIGGQFGQTVTVQMNGTTDYVEVWGQTNQAAQTGTATLSGGRIL